MGRLDGLSRGDLLRLAEQQQGLLAELVAARERDAATIAELRTANERARAEIADLRAERETTRAAMAELRAANGQLRARVLELEGELAKLKQGGPRGMPGLKSDEPVVKAEAPPRKRREHGVGRARSAPTRSVVHAAERCPDCGTELSGGSVKRTREVIVKLRLEVHHPFAAKVRQRFTAKLHQVEGCADDDLSRQLIDWVVGRGCQVVGIGTSGAESGRSAMRKLRPEMRRTAARWPRRSRPALARSGSPNSSGHSVGARLLVTTMLPFS